jgi:hypothetical protein
MPLVSPWGGEIIIKELEKPSKNWQFYERTGKRISSYEGAYLIYYYFGEPWLYIRTDSFDFLNTIGYEPRGLPC